MATPSRFWQVLNRINAVLFFLFILFCFLAGAAILMTLFGTTGSSEQPQISIEDDSSVDDSIDGWFLGRSEKIGSTHYFRVPLQSKPLEQSGKIVSGGYASSRGYVRNYLFTNSDTNSSCWLFSNNDQVVNQTIPLALERNSDAVETLYLVARIDSNGDLQLNNDDLQEIGYSKVTGENYRVIVEGVEKLNGAHLTKTGRVIFFFQKNGAGYQALFDPQRPGSLVVKSLPVIQ